LSIRQLVKPEFYEKVATTGNNEGGIRNILDRKE
jgi:hypothetical protein